MFSALLSSLLVLALLFVLVLQFKWRSIEQDIADSSLLALNTAGFTWAGIRTHNRGRDVLLLGTRAE